MRPGLILNREGRMLAEIRELGMFMENHFRGVERTIRRSQRASTGHLSQNRNVSMQDL